MNVHNTFKSPAKTSEELEQLENSGELPVIPAEEFTTWHQYTASLNNEDHEI